MWCCDKILVKVAAYVIPVHSAPHTHTHTHTHLTGNYAAENAPDIVRRILSGVQLTQYDMLPQHQVNIRKLISECF